MRPGKLALGARLRSDLLHAPPFLLGTVFFGSMALLASLFDKDGRLQHRIARRWARFSIWASGTAVEVIGLENIPEPFEAAVSSSPAGRTSEVSSAVPAESAVRHCAVYAANHTSYMDTPVVFSSLPFQFRILAKKELWTIPFIGWYLKRSGQIPIDTDNPRATLSSLGNGIRTLRDGLSVFVFPEGGRTPDGALQSFLNGAAYLAIRGQVPLVPIALVGVYDLLPIHTRHFFHTGERTRLIIGKPLATMGRTLRESDALTLELKLAIDAMIREHSATGKAPSQAGPRG